MLNLHAIKKHWRTNSNLFFLFALAFANCNTLKASGTLSIYPTVDSYVSASATSANYGTNTNLMVQYSSELLTYITLGYSGLPANAIITKAELLLWASAVTSSSSVFNFDLVSASWNESTITYTNKPAISGSGRITKSGFVTTGYTSIDITSWMLGWQASTIYNYGIRLSAAASGNSATFYSSEHATTSYRPVLKITYISPADALTWTNITGGFAASGNAFSGGSNGGTANSINILEANVDGAVSFALSSGGQSTNTIQLGLSDVTNPSVIKYGLGITYNTSTTKYSVQPYVGTTNVGSAITNVSNLTVCGILREGNNIFFKVGSSLVSYPGNAADGALRLIVRANMNTGYGIYISPAYSSFDPYYENLALSSSYTPALSDKNYIRTVTRLDKTTPFPTTGARNIKQFNDDVQYFDGLGRPIETVSVAASPTGKDIVSQLGYDEVGRQNKSYLPFTQSANNGAYIDGTTALVSFYTNGVANGVPVETNADYLNNQTVFEASPLNRVNAQMGPGSQWRTNTKMVNTIYLTNAGGSSTETIFGNVYKFSITEATNATLRKTGCYAAGTLYVTMTIDEDSHVIVEYKDIEGRVVMKEAKETSGVVTGLRTYYIYDDFGLLRYVIPPAAINSIATGTTAATYAYDVAWVKEYCYLYEYDAKHRMIVKRLPGAEPVYMVYDARDRLVLTQDGVQRASNVWAFTKYDVLNRPVITGYITCSIAVTTLRTSFGNELSRLYETPSPANAYLYSLNNSYPASPAFPNITTGDIFTITYYDSYPSVVTGLGYTQLATDFDATISSNTIGRVTVTKVRTLTANTSFAPTNTFTTTQVFYDKYGRVIGTSALDYNNLTTFTNTKYDFTGNVLKTQKQVKNGAAELVAVTQRMTYDHRNRLLDTYHKIGTNSEILLSQNLYNELGQLKEKRTGLPTLYKPYLQYTDYSYNIRGWLTGINSSALNEGDGDLFGMDLLYNTTNSQLANVNYYNGNISGIVWKMNTLEKKGYSFGYDGYNRLLSATYKQGSTLATYNGFSENMTYDANGNIATLNRFQLGTQIDGLTYHYMNSEKSNRLLYVDDSKTSAGFYAANTANTTDYTYDLNGNMNADYNKKLNIVYNYLNLPAKITTSVNATDKVEYLYDALGTKLAKKPNADATAAEYYMGDVVLKGSAFGVEYVITPEGKANNASGAYTYEYHLKDHLGNTRVAYIAGTNGAAEVKQQADYYPFGMMISNTAEAYAANDNDYLYNGKERQDNLLGGVNLDLYDYGARMYDPQLGRWHNVDPLAELSRRWSPYSYCYNNPIRFIDPDGMLPDIPRLYDDPGSNDPLDDPNYHPIDPSNRRLFPGFKPPINRNKWRKDDPDFDPQDDPFNGGGQMPIIAEGDGGEGDPPDSKGNKGNEKSDGNEVSFKELGLSEDDWNWLTPQDKSILISEYKSCTSGLFSHDKEASEELIGILQKHAKEWVKTEKNFARKELGRKLVTELWLGTYWFFQRSMPSFLFIDSQNLNPNKQQYDPGPQ